MGQKPLTTRFTAPLISDELLQYLDALYPMKCPSLTDTNRTVWRDVGRREVVDHLRREQQIQRARQPTNNMK